MLKNQDKKKRKNKSSLLILPQICIKCITNQYLQQIKQYSLQYLSFKYSNSQNFFYTKDINDIIQGLSTPMSIKIKDLKFYDETGPIIKDIVKKSYLKQQIKNMSEYYRYYNTQPNFFIAKIDKIMKQYKQKKKLLVYKQMHSKIQSTSLIKQIANPNQVEYKLLGWYQNNKNKRETLLSTNAQIINAKNRKSQYEKKEDSMQEMRSLKQKLTKAINKYETNNKKEKMNLVFVSNNSFINKQSAINQLSNIEPANDYLNSIILPNYDNYGLIQFKEEFEKKKKCMKKKEKIIDKNNEDCKKKSLKKSFGEKQLTTSNSRKKLSNNSSKSKLANVKKKSIQKYEIDNNLHKRYESETNLMKPSTKVHKYTSSYAYKH